MFNLLILTTVHCLDNGYMGEQPVAWKEFLVEYCLTLSSIYSFEHIEEKGVRKTLWEKVKLLKMSNFTFFHNVFYAICIFKSFKNHISVIVSRFFEFGTVSKWCIREMLKRTPGKHGLVNWRPQYH